MFCSPDTPSAGRSNEVGPRVDRTQRLVCIIAAQRAGTTALQHLITTAGLVNYGEIFHTQPNKNAKGAFLQFAEEQNIRLFETATRAGAIAIAERYLDWLYEQAGAADFLIDVKLNSWSILSHWWWYPQREPLFLGQLKQRSAIFVLIWRDNLCDQVLSHFIAKELGVWHNFTETNIAGRTIEAPVERLRKLALTISRAETDMLGHLHDHPGKIVIRYEDLFQEGGVVAKRFRRAFRRIAGIDLPRNFPGVRSSSPDKRAIINNYDQVAAAIRPISKRRRQQIEARTSKS
jgi:hypothetical protein